MKTSGYTQASLQDKKYEVAGKMKYSMNGSGSTKGGGMKAVQNGKSSGKGGGMSYAMRGQGKGAASKAPMANTKGNFSTNYKQNG